MVLYFLLGVDDRVFHKYSIFRQEKNLHKIFAVRSKVFFLGKQKAFSFPDEEGKVFSE